MIHNICIFLIISFFSFCFSFTLDGSSITYTKFSSWIPCHNGSISFHFKTQKTSALLLYTDGGKASTDYFELKLVNGVLNLVFNINKARKWLSAGQKLNNNEWHSVGLIRDGRITTLKVDELSYFIEDEHHESSYKVFVNSDNFVFIGGLPIDYNQRLNDLAHPLVVFEPRLSGSVQNIFYSNCGNAMMSPVMLQSEGLTLGDNDCMKKNECKNGGICFTVNDGITCDCSMTDYIGEFCEIEKQVLEAKFQGKEYIVYDLSQHGDAIVSSNDVLSMSFKTTYMNGLLFYTGEHKDYMMVSLKNGAIYFAMDLGSGTYNKIVENAYKLDDGQWHQVAITRNSRQITISVDGQDKVKGSTVGDYIQLSSNIIYVAGWPNHVDAPGIKMQSNFKGCLKKVEYQADSIKLDLIELARKDHSLISVQGNVTFGACKKVIDSQSVTFTTSESFVTLPRWDVQKGMGTISFLFQTTELDGLIMYNSGSHTAKDTDFFAFEIIDGHFYLVLNLGTGAYKQRVSRTIISDGDPHLVNFHFGGKKGFIRIDSHQTEYSTSGLGSDLNLEESLFVGGMDFNHYDAYRLPPELWSAILKRGFVGCIQDLTINDDKIDLMAIAQKEMQQNIRSECRRMDSQCLSQPCLHRGICTKGWNRYICDCKNTSYMGTNCEHAAATLTFDEAHYVLVKLPKESVTEAEDISLRFHTVRSSGLLLMTSSEHSKDAIELYLERGACKLIISLGGASKALSMGHNLNDDQWHTVYIKRRGHVIDMQIDSKSTVTGIDSRSRSNTGFKRAGREQQMPNDEQINPHPGFVGSMQQFVYNGNHYFDIALEQNVEDIEVTARFDNGESILQNEVTFQSWDSYVGLPHQLLKSNHMHFALSFKFKTLHQSGLMLFSGLASHDFLALELYKGFLYYIYNMGAGSKRILIYTPEPLNDNKWHDVSLFRPLLDQQQIRVDNYMPTVDDLKGHTARQFDLKGPLYIGGVIKTKYNLLPVKVLSHVGYLGCMASLEINSERINIIETATEFDDSDANLVVKGCSSTQNMCHTQSCYHGGRCEQQWNSYVCNCDMTSYVGPMCTEASVSYRFGSGNGLIVFEYPLGARPSTKNDYLVFGITTVQNAAKLVRIDSADSDDFIEMELVQGNIFMVYNMGQENIPVVTLQQKVNDGKYHVIKFVRTEANASLEVDNEITHKTPVGTKMNVFNNQGQVRLGGHKNSKGLITHEFHGTISGFFFNGLHLLDLLRDGDHRVRVEGDVTLVEPSQELTSPEKVIIPGVNVIEMQSTQGVKISIPTKDEIIFSGDGPDCYNEDDECVSVPSEDDIITPTIIITRLSTPKPEPNVKANNSASCKDCAPVVMELDPKTNTSGNYSNQYVISPSRKTTTIPGANEAKSTTDSGHLNIFLIIGIAAGVLVALIILVIALYKFRSRDEGTYRVDESQNFAYLEAKKQRTTNSSIATAVGNGGKISSKKKDVKEWYV